MKPIKEDLRRLKVKSKSNDLINDTDEYPNSFFKSMDEQEKEADIENEAYELRKDLIINKK